MSKEFFEWPGNAQVLAVILHGWASNSEKISDVKDATLEALGPKGGVDIYVPTLAYSRQLSVERATTILIDLLRKVDKIVEKRPNYKRIVLIGHSLGGVLSRRLFLLAAGVPPAADGQPEFQYEEEFMCKEAAPRPWAELIDRHVTLGAFNRGWQASERDGWYYSIFFNIMGLMGHLAPKSRLRPTVFDLRVGAPFIVQTRLHWLAYRRFHQALGRRSTADEQTTVPPAFARELLVVQIVGNSDDLSSPLNQVDIAIERPDNSIPPSDRRFFFIEMSKSTHEQAIKFTGSPEGSDRRELFKAALTERPEELARRASDPTLLVDDLPQVEPSVTDAIFVMHGIRDDGFWTARIAKRVRERNPGACVVRARTPTYGYFAMLPFLLPWIRRQKVEWFMDQYVAARAQYPNAQISFVGHSNGTYLAACALRNYAEARFKNIFFAGSVVRRDYPWLSLVRDGRVQRFHNVRAARDWVVALLPKSVEWLKFFDLGGGGFDGFNDAGEDSRVTQLKEFADGMHSAALVESQWRHIADFAVDGTAPPAKPSEAFVGKPSAFLKKLADTYCGIPFLLLVGLVVLPGFLIWLFWNNPVLLTLALVIYVLLLKFVITRV